MSFTEVQQAEQHFNSAHNTAEASQYLITDVENIMKADKGNTALTQADMAKLNHDLDLTKQGFPAGFTILDASDNGLVLQDSNDKGHVQVYDNTGAKKFDGSSVDLDGQKTATTGDGQTRDYQVNQGDSLWKIAKQDLPDKATNKEILDHMHQIEALNPNVDESKYIHPGDTLKLPAKTDDGSGAGTGNGDKTPADPNKTSDGGTVTTDDQGNKVTKWDDGTERHENADGTGYVKRPDNSEQHWGPKAEDNYDLTTDGKKLPVTYTDDNGRVEHLPDNSTLTTWDDGTRRRDNPDGSGFVQNPDHSEQHWGPKPEDNYEITPEGAKVKVDYATDGSGGVTKTQQNGDKVTTWPNGAEEHENSDGSVGYAKNQDGSEHHWGPSPDQNYDVTTDGGRQTTDSDGNKITTWPDGSVRYDNVDGSGESRQHQPDGSYKDHHWGPNSGQNYDDTEPAPAQKTA